MDSDKKGETVFTPTATQLKKDTDMNKLQKEEHQPLKGNTREEVGGCGHLCCGFSLGFRTVTPIINKVLLQCYIFVVVHKKVKPGVFCVYENGHKSLIINATLWSNLLN